MSERTRARKEARKRGEENLKRRAATTEEARQLLIVKHRSKNARRNRQRRDRYQPGDGAASASSTKHIAAAPLPPTVEGNGDVTPPSFHDPGDDFHADFGGATPSPSDVGDATPVPMGVGDSDTEMTDLELAAARHATAADVERAAESHAATAAATQPASEPLVSSASPPPQLPPGIPIENRERAADCMYRVLAYLQESRPQDGPWTLDQVEKMMDERTSGSKPFPVVETMSEQQPDRTRDDDSTRAAIAVAGSGNGIQPLPPHMWLEPKITNPHRGP